MSDQTPQPQPQDTGQVEMPSVDASGAFDEASAVIVGPVDEVVEVVFIALRQQAVARGETPDEAALRKQAKDRVSASHVDLGAKPTAPAAAPQAAQPAPQPAAAPEAPAQPQQAPQQPQAAPQEPQTAQQAQPQQGQANKGGA